MSFSLHYCGCDILVLEDASMVQKMANLTIEITMA